MADSMKTFDGKVALVTGAAGGLGSAICDALAADGATVAMADRHDTELPGAPDCVFRGDLSEPDYADGLPHAVVDRLGRLDILVNNAGVMRRGAITEAGDEDLSISMAVNVEAPFRLCRAAIPIMASAGGGAIVNVASCWGVHPGPGHLIYCMSKAAVASMTQCLGRDHAHQGIRVNAVCPNEVNTAMLKTGFERRGFDPEKAIEDLNATVPLGHIAEPDEIADVVVFLASDAARYLCGSLVEANGGKPVG